MRVVCTRGWIFQRIETCVAAPYVFWDAANKRMFSCLYCWLVGLVPMNWCRHRIPRFFPFHQFFLPPPTTNESDPTRIPTSRFIDDDETRSSLDCFFFLRGSIYPVESDSLQFPKRSQRNGAWNSIAVHAIFNVSPNRFTRKNVQTAII